MRRPRTHETGTRRALTRPKVGPKRKAQTHLAEEHDRSCPRWDGGPCDCGGPVVELPRAGEAGGTA